MTLSQSTAKRIHRLLRERNMTQYRLEKITGIQHGTMNGILNARYRDVKLGTLVQISEGFGLTVWEFLDDEMFRYENLDL